MKRILILAILGVMFSCKDDEVPAPSYKHSKYEMPHETFGLLYREFQIRLEDKNKEFVDGRPLRPINEILNDFRRAKNDRDFEFEDFVKENFYFPERTTSYKNDPERNMHASIDLLWQAASKSTEALLENENTCIELPNPFISAYETDVDQHYFDSYFILQGLKEKGNWEMIENMIDNFAYMIREVGHVPPINRTYTASRSEFPTFSLMVEMLVEEKGEEVYGKYLDALAMEYEYWMDNKELISTENVDSGHVAMVDGYVWNRYYDPNPEPRPENYARDVKYETAASWRQSWETMQEIRAAAESGWMFSGRFMTRWNYIGHVSATSVIPVDLNCAIYHLEKTLTRAFKHNGQSSKSQEFADKMEERKNRIQELFWDAESSTYRDYNFKDSTFVRRVSAVTVYPLFYEIASASYADSVATFVQENLLKPGGMIGSVEDGQRWDAPFAISELNYLGVIALQNYGYEEIASRIVDRWSGSIETVYAEKGYFPGRIHAEDLSWNLDYNPDFHIRNHLPTVAIYNIWNKPLNSD